MTGLRVREKNRKSADNLILSNTDLRAKTYTQEWVASY